MGGGTGQVMSWPCFPGSDQTDSNLQPGPSGPLLQVDGLGLLWSSSRELQAFPYGGVIGQSEDVSSMVWSRVSSFFAFCLNLQNTAKMYDI